MTDTEYFKPSNLSEATAFLAEHGSAATVLAGGTDVIVNLRERVLSCKYLVDIKGIPEMQELSYSPDSGLTVGGAVTVNQLIAAKDVMLHYPLLVQAGKTLANTLVRNRATLVGNLCNASPAADLAPAALVLGASLEVLSCLGSRQIPLSAFFLGVKCNALNPGEIVVKAMIPPAEGQGVYLKKSRIKGHDLAQIGVAGFLSSSGELRLALGAVAPRPVIVSGLEAFAHQDLLDETIAAAIIDTVLEQVSPISDQRASQAYRLAMLQYAVKQVLAALGKGAKQ